MKQVWIVLSLVGLPVTHVAAQEAESRWEPAIKKFEEADQKSPPPENNILFVGSSSIRMWDLDKSFPGAPMLNRGFGGSQISDVNQYFDRVVLKYHPRAIVFYAGDNDIARGKSVAQVTTDYHAFLRRVAKELPKTQVVYLPIKPSRARWQLWPQMNDANQKIRKLCLQRYQWHYADTATPMLDSPDQPPADSLFVEDGLHLSEAGYAVWDAVLKPVLHRALTLPEVEARGRVYHDENRNRRLDDGELLMPGVRVSNGREVVTTNGRGEYALPIDNDDAVFVVKPAGWRTPLNPERLPQFYYLHKPAGSPPSKFPGVAPTGDLPESIDFALYPQREPEKFRAIMFGDPQPRDQKEVDYVAHDVVEQLIGTDASFGVTLGDIMFDNLALFQPQNQVIALLGIPWYNVIGNHDLNLEARNDRQSDETFERIYGPSYYSFDYGSVHFVVLDNVEWFVQGDAKKGTYRGGFGPDQLEFVKNDLAAIPHNQLVVMLMHIPLNQAVDRQALYRLIEHRPFCISLSGHTHTHEHRMIDKADGWRGIKPHHHIVNVTVSGSWWSGAPDERGIPHALMPDGAPNGYSVITFDGHRYTLDFRAAGRPADYQLNIQVPDEVAVDQLAETPVYVNVFNGSARSKVEMRAEGQKQWRELKQVAEADPQFKRLFETENAIAGKSWRDLASPRVSTHLWRGELPGDLKPGVRMLHVRTTDMHGRTYHAGRVVRVK